MEKALRPASVIPPGFTIVTSSVAEDNATILVRSTSRTNQCPKCGSASCRVHSRYRRQIFDLPLAGRAVKLMTDVRRFRCEAVRCGQKIFTERFADGVLAPWARRTGRLETLVHHLGLAPGGRPAASFARRLMLPVSNDTLLRVVRRRGCRWKDAPAFYGPAKTLYNRCVRWAAKDVWRDVFEALAAAGGPPSEVLIDSTHVKAHRSAAGGKGGLTRRRLAAAGAAATPRFTPSPTDTAGHSPSI